MGRRYAFIAILLGAVVLPVALLYRAPVHAEFEPAGTSDQDRTRVVKFSHKKHIVDNSVECTACHEAALTSKQASDNLLTTQATCGTCHDIQDTTQCSKCHFENATPIGFENPPRDILFNHELHVSGQKLECTTCHTGLESTDYGTAANMPTMKTCNTCHNNLKVSNTCETCHRNFAMMKPPDHRQSGFVRMHRNETRLGALTVECATCHAETFCQECHQGAGLKAFTERDRTTDAGPKRSTQDSPNQTVLQNVHGLNYRFTHGIDAKSRQTECASCHDAETFCAECHNAGGNITQVKIKPASHLVAGFVTIGGAGGGLHAEEAKRDIEECISCHNVEGQDPTCLTCHMENGRVR